MPLVRTEPVPAAWINAAAQTAVEEAAGRAVASGASRLAGSVLGAMALIPVREIRDSYTCRRERCRGLERCSRPSAPDGQPPHRPRQRQRGNQPSPRRKLQVGSRAE